MFYLEREGWRWCGFFFFWLGCCCSATDFLNDSCEDRSTSCASSSTRWSHLFARSTCKSVKASKGTFSHYIVFLLPQTVPANSNATEMLSVLWNSITYLNIASLHKWFPEETLTLLLKQDDLSKMTPAATDGSTATTTITSVSYAEATSALLSLMEVRSEPKDYFIGSLFSIPETCHVLCSSEQTLPVAFHRRRLAQNLRSDCISFHVVIFDTYPSCMAKQKHCECTYLLPLWMLSRYETVRRSCMLNH